MPTAERITETIDDCKFSCQNKYSTLQRMDECHLTVTKAVTTSRDVWLQLEWWNK